MQKKQKRADENAKKPAPARRKPYTAPKLTVHGRLGHLTAGSGSKSWQPTA